MHPPVAAEIAEVVKLQTTCKDLLMEIDSKLKNLKLKQQPVSLYKKDYDILKIVAEYFGFSMDQILVKRHGHRRTEFKLARWFSFHYYKKL